MDETQQAASEKKSSTGPIVAIVGLIVIVVVAVVAFQSMNKPAEQTQQAPTQQTQQQTQETTTEANTTTETAATYKDGTYTADGDYTSPGGAEQVGVTLTIEKGVVTSSEIEVKATRPISKTRQTDFKDNYKAQVEGKNIDEIVLSKISGSSLTPKGFNDAVEKIKEQAKQQS